MRAVAMALQRGILVMLLHFLYEASCCVPPIGVPVWRAVHHDAVVRGRPSLLKHRLQLAGHAASMRTLRTAL